MEDGEFYLDLFFDVNRGGFFDVAQRILNFLDYKSFVQFKRSCKMVYKFIRSSNIEQVSGSEKKTKVHFRSRIHTVWKFEDFSAMQISREKWPI